MNKDIERIFERKIEIQNIIIPVEYANYDGNSEEYVVYFNTGSEPKYSEDDEITYSENSVEFHIYSKGNYLKIVDIIKKKLKENDYIWDGDSDDLYETDTKYHHFVSSFKKINYIL